MKKVILVLAITFSGMLFMAGCKKNTNDVLVAMKIKTFTASVNNIDYLTYEYKYDGDLIKRVEAKSIDEIATSLYTNGKIDSAWRKSNGTMAIAIKYTYSNNEVLQKHYFIYTDTVLITESTHSIDYYGKILKSIYYWDGVINYAWENGNCVLITDNANMIIDYTYDNKENPFKDIFTIPSWQEPMFFYSTNNVKASVNQDGKVIHYNYEYNSNGYPIKAISDGASVYQYKYEYY